jgi:phenylalanyl-tRNA synthetase beta chain
MKFSEQWLREWVDPPISREQLAEQLTMAGLEVGSVEPVAARLTSVVVGRIAAVEPHPNADRLTVCSVDVGAEQPLHIVCGAPNVRAGMLAPAALVGAELAGGMRIERAELRGVESFGMLCSSAELGLTETAEGLMELTPDSVPGTPIVSALGLDDAILELELTPNRGDCLSIAGIAREVGALNRLDVRSPRIEPIPAELDERFPVRIDAPADCPRYVGRIIRDIDPSAPTPLWMQERLRRSGLRSLGPLVDVTNYVLLELGQPMHAFDLEQLRGEIRVRRAEPGETLTLLDEKQVRLDPDTLLIADRQRPLAMAGIMGGLSSGVSSETRHLFLESAFFAPAAIIGRARRHALQTDSSYRFERGVDPTLQARAMERATRLLLDIVGGRAGPLVDLRSEAHLPRPAPIALRQGRIDRLLGFEIPTAEVDEMLTRLGMRIEGQGELRHVTAPELRFDIGQETDLVEEVARIYGYQRIPATLPVFAPRMSEIPEGKPKLAGLRQSLIADGYQEVVTYSFVDPQQQQRIDPEHTAVALANPLSNDQAVMRTSLWPGLLATLAYNRNRQQSRVRLFETGLVFHGDGKAVRQIPVIGGAVSGSVDPEQWAEPGREADFFDLKGDVERLLALAAPPTSFGFERREHPALHPGQTTAVMRNGREIGVLGALHPALEEQLGLSGVFLFELDLQMLDQGRVPAFQPLSRFPAIRRDLALLIDRDTPAGRVLERIRETAGEVLTELVLFDVYTGKGIDPALKSLALGLTLQDASRTLMDSEVETLVTRVVDRLRQDFAATLRD